MTSTNPTPDEARQLLAMTAGAAGSLRAAGQNRHAQWLTGLATSTFMFYVGLSTIPDSRPGARPVRRLHALRRRPVVRAAPRGSDDQGGHGPPLGQRDPGWGVAYGVSLIVGLNWLQESVLFWLLASVVVTAPLAVGAWREGRA